MSYAAAADLALRLGRRYTELYRDYADAAVEDLAQAAAEIDAYLGGRYAVPVTAAAALVLLQDWNLTLAEEKAYARAGGGVETPEKVIRRVDAARKALRDAASGLLRLPGAAEAAAAGAGAAGAVVIEIEPPIFGRKRMKGY